MKAHLTGLAIIIALCLASPVAAAVIPAVSCSQADVLTAVTRATEGDTVTVPAGQCTWTGTLTIDKNITLQRAGIGQTVITDSRPEGPSGERWVIRNFSIGSTGVFRITGFTFQSDAGLQTVLTDGFIQLGGCSTTNANYRIDHNRFNQMQNVAVRTYGSLFGVIDHNDIINYPGSGFAMHNHYWWPRDGVTCTGRVGDGSWAAPLEPGTIKAHYIESNTITSWHDSHCGVCGAIVDSNTGARTVVRYNTLTHTGVGSHGTDSGQRNRGQRWIETYENTFTYPNNEPGSEYGIDSVAWYRGGSGVFFDNRVTISNLQSGFNWLVKHLNLRSDDLNGRTFPPWESATHRFPNCDGTAPWDGNSGDASGAGYRCLDQPGAGTSVDFLDADPPPNIPANNALEPIYVWNNTVNGVVNNCANGNGCASDGVVVAGRDIIFGTARPGYTPLVYPHPLVSSVPTRTPQRPAGLLIK
jgi:hypothetical protein